MCESLYLCLYMAGLLRRLAWFKVRIAPRAVPLHTNPSFNEQGFGRTNALLICWRKTHQVDDGTCLLGATSPISNQLGGKWTFPQDYQSSPGYSNSHANKIQIHILINSNRYGDSYIWPMTHISLLIYWKKLSYLLLYGCRRKRRYHK